MKSSPSTESLIELQAKLIDDTQQENELNELNDSLASIKIPVLPYVQQDKEHFTQNIKKYLKLTTAKLIAILLIFAFTFYHGYLNSFYGRNSCNRLLEQGYLKGDNQWQPSGCMIHNYTNEDAQICFKYTKYFNGKNNFVFLGDGRIRQVFKSFISQFDSKNEFNDFKFRPEVNNTIRTSTNPSTSFSYKRNFSPDFNFSTDINDDLDYKDYIYTSSKFNLEISFIWRPVIDDTLMNLIEFYLSNQNRPSFIVLGMASHYLNNNHSVKESLDLFKTNLTNLIDLIKSFESDSKYTKASNLSLWSWSQASSIYWMLQDRLDEYKYYFNKTYNDQFTNDEIDSFNSASINLLYNTPVNIWSSNRLVSKVFQDTPDGFQIGDKSLKIYSQTLLNLYCNNRMSYKDGSCCSQPETMSLIQQIIFSIYILIFLITIVLFMYRYFFYHYLNYRINMFGPEISLTTSCKNAASSNGFYDLFKTLSKFSVFMFYFFACDRANYFMKENQHFTMITFLIPFVYVSIIGLFFQDKLPLAKNMNRYQTDEVKGFMQMFILFYRLSSAEESTTLYLLVRLFSGTYLFLSGYGHFMYYWNTSNFSITRFFEFLFRVNFLPIMLCFTMNRMYQFYAFIPLITFWFVCAYTLMVMYPRVSANTAKDNPYHFIYMITKLFIFIGIITLLNLSDNLFEKIFIARPWKFMFVNSDDLLTDWRKNWSAHCYSFVFGMMFALISCILRRLNLIDDYENNLDQYEDDNLEFREKRRDKFALSFHKKIVLVLLSLTGLISFAVFILLCKSKDECDAYIPYIMIIPVVSYFTLRNTVQFLREKCSFMFSWFGRISLELYACSFHIWLAADSNGVLVLLPDYTVLNSIITIFIFACVAHELNITTRRIGEYMFPNSNWRICLRNFICFVILLMPIAIKYGYI